MKRYVFVFAIILITCSNAFAKKSRFIDAHIVLQSGEGFDATVKNWFSNLITKIEVIREGSSKKLNIKCDDISSILVKGEIDTFMIIHRATFPYGKKNKKKYTRK